MIELDLFVQILHLHLNHVFILQPGEPHGWDLFTLQSVPDVVYVWRYYRTTHINSTCCDFLFKYLKFKSLPWNPIRVCKINCSVSSLGGFEHIENIMLLCFEGTNYRHNTCSASKALKLWYFYGAKKWLNNET